MSCQNDSFKPSIITFVVTYVSDVEKSSNFWKEILGFESPFPAFSHWTSLHPKGTTAENFDTKRETGLGVHLASKDDPNNSAGKVHLNFLIDGVDKFHEVMVSRKDVEVLEPPKSEPWGGKTATYRGPDGIIFETVEAKHDDPEKESQPKKQKTEHTTEHKECVDEKPKEKENGSPSLPFGVCHLDLPVGDLKRAQKFYTDAFGWKFTAWKDEYSLFNSQCKEYPLAGGFRVTTKRIDFPFLYIHTPTLKEGIEKVKNAGAKIIGEIDEIPQVGVDIEFEDSEGNHLYLWSRTRE